jgi:hypothetical protein
MLSGMQPYYEMLAVWSKAACVDSTCHSTNSTLPNVIYISIHDISINGNALLQPPWHALVEVV